MQRVVVTGLGAITPLGLCYEEYWRNLCAGISGVERIPAFVESNYPVQIAAEATGFDPEDFMERKAARRMDRFAQFAVAASGQALRDAELEITPANSERVGVMMNTGGGGIQTMVRESLHLHADGPSHVSPFTVPMITPNMAACQVSITYGIDGPVLSSVAACAAGVQAVIDARRMLQLGEVDVMLAGAAEALVGFAVIALGNMHALSRRNEEPRKASRPFDRDRDGCVMGEGGAVLVLETEAHARRRDARIYGEVIGGALTADAYHVSLPAPNGAGAARAMRNAISNAKVTPRDLDYICAHGTATPANDRAETTAIKAVCGDDAYRIPSSSPKSMIGHMFGASGAVSALTCLLAIRDNIVPPTINLDNPDPECDLDYVPNIARERRVDTAMANAFGFGGQNAVAIFRRYDNE